MLKVAWMGTAALLMDAGQGVVAFDPFGGIPYGALSQGDGIRVRGKFQNARAVLVTHGHFDHIRDIPALYGDGRTPVYATRTPCATLKASGVPAAALHEIAPEWQGEVCRLSVRALQGRHCRFDRGIIRKTILRGSFFARPKHTARLLMLNRAFPENGETLFYEITDGSARVQVMGSLGLDDATRYPTDADCLILPFQGRSDLTNTAMPIVERLRPKRICLDHYDDAFPPMSSQIDTSSFCEEVRKRLGIPCAPMEQGVELTIERAYS